MKHFKTVSRVTKLDSKSMYYVARLLPSINTVIRVKKDIKSLSKAIALLDSMDNDVIDRDTEALKEDLKEFTYYFNGFKKLLSEEVKSLSLNNLNLFTEDELKFINNLIDN